MPVGVEFLFLTPKGMDELRSRAYKLDLLSRNVLFLIERGSATSDAILQRSIFPRDAVLERLSALIAAQFVAVAPGRESGRRVNGAARPLNGAGGTANGGAADATDSTQGGEALMAQYLQLGYGIALSQARFALSDFCLDQFGTQGKGLVDALGLARDVAALQLVVNRIGVEVRKRFPDRLAKLVVCVREINETDPESTMPPEAEAGATPDTGLGVVAAPGRGPAGVPPGARANGAADLRLQSGISLSQGRFALSEFCLDQFGTRGQSMVEEVTRCRSVPELQNAVERVAAEVRDRLPDRLTVLVACVSGINETGA